MRSTSHQRPRLPLQRRPWPSKLSASCSFLSLEGDGICLRISGTLTGKSIAQLLFGTTSWTTHISVEDKPQRVPDSGAARIVADTLEGHPHSPQLASTTRPVIAWKLAQEHKLTISSTVDSVTKSEVYDFIDANSGIKEAVELATRYSPWGDLSPTSPRPRDITATRP